MAAIHRLINVFLRRAWTGQFTRRPCRHLDMVSDSQSAAEVCIRDAYDRQHGAVLRHNASLEAEARSRRFRRSGLTEGRAWR
jgi:hypothetical protein